MPAWNQICNHISTATGSTFQMSQTRNTGGGCINDTNTIIGLSDGIEKQYFVKLNSAHNLDMFEAEAAGLTEIAVSNSIQVPNVICAGETDGETYLVLEHITFGRSNADSATQLGSDLACMHRHQSKQFGWFRDNTIGSTEQRNTLSNDWCQFWRDNRLGFQLALAADNGYKGNLQRNGKALMDKLEHFFVGHTPEPSLLHGDLWSGNYNYDQQGSPVIFDPALYYGDRETDIAMTELFGGFPPAFYEAYQAAYPLDEGYQQRKILYNLYHILNHLNLFGSGYLGQAEAMISKLLSEVR